LEFVVISKAFDSVSHVTIDRSAEAFGAPSPHVRNAAQSCENAGEVFQNSEVHSQRGVRQGDNLPLLFIMTMDDVSELSMPQLRKQFHDMLSDVLTFPDELVDSQPDYSPKNDLRFPQTECHSMDPIYALLRAKTNISTGSLKKDRILDSQTTKRGTPRSEINKGHKPDLRRTKVTPKSTRLRRRGMRSLNVTTATANEDTGFWWMRDFVECTYTHIHDSRLNGRLPVLKQPSW
ncbi:hypothetical protein T265_14728, partial [Opisthorchis viverrini]